MNSNSDKNTMCLSCSNNIDQLNKSEVEISDVQDGIIGYVCKYCVDNAEQCILCNGIVYKLDTYDIPFYNKNGSIIGYACKKCIDTESIHSDMDLNGMYNRFEDARYIVKYTLTKHNDNYKKTVCLSCLNRDKQLNESGIEIQNVYNEMIGYVCQPCVDNAEECVLCKEIVYKLDKYDIPIYREDNSIVGYVCKKCTDTDITCSKLDLNWKYLWNYLSSRSYGRISKAHIMYALENNFLDKLNTNSFMSGDYLVEFQWHLE